MYLYSLQKASCEGEVIFIMKCFCISICLLLEFISRCILMYNVDFCESSFQSCFEICFAIQRNTLYSTYFEGIKIRFKTYEFNKEQSKERMPVLTRELQVVKLPKQTFQTIFLFGNSKTQLHHVGEQSQQSEKQFCLCLN